jgi:hypothetical protein
MSNTDQLGALEYEQEASWCVATSTFATHRWPILEPLNISGLTEQADGPERVVQQLQGGTTPVRSVRGGEFDTLMWLHGHGGATSGAVTIDPIETIMAYAFGDPSLSEANSCPTRSATSGTTVNGSGSTTTNIVTTASGTFAVNSLFRLGTGGISADGRGSGQFYPVTSHTTTNLVPRFATITAAANTDAVHSAVNFYLPETPTNASVKSWRGRWVTPDQQVIMRGIYPKAMTFAGLNGTEKPTFGVKWGVSDWDSARVAVDAATYPSTVTQNQYNPAANAGGSFIVGDFGSTVRTAYNVRDFSITVELGVHPFPGHTGVGPRQSIIGARRTPSKIRWSFIVDATTGAAENIWETKYEAGTAIWIMNTLSSAAGSAVGFWMQNCKIDRVPTLMSHNGINSIKVEGYACAGTTVTTELSQAALVVGFA